MRNMMMTVHKCVVQADLPLAEVEAEIITSAALWSNLFLKQHHLRLKPLLATVVHSQVQQLQLLQQQGAWLSCLLVLLLCWQRCWGLVLLSQQPLLRQRQLQQRRKQSRLCMWSKAMCRLHLAEVAKCICCMCWLMTMR
jgi:hypothetical protein